MYREKDYSKKNLKKSSSHPFCTHSGGQQETTSYLKVAIKQTAYNREPKLDQLIGFTD